MAPPLQPVVPADLFSVNRASFLKNLLATQDPRLPHSAVVLEGGRSTCRHDTDHEDLFRQESFFHYLFGVAEPDFFGAILVDGTTLLFIPRLPDEYKVWMGDILPPSHFKNKYAVDAVHFVDELPQALQALGVTTLHLLSGTNSDSGTPFRPPHPPGADAFALTADVAWGPLVEARVFKSAQEVALLRQVNALASAAHVEVMRRCRGGLVELQLESLFLHFCYAMGGARHVSYTCICASGKNGAILHYGHAAAPNDRTVGGGEMVLMDMGCEFVCYASDITCSYPANGKFTPPQRFVYEAVLRAHDDVIAAMRPGVAWADMHR
jgi:Xaa-Pro dipeptidase